MAFFQSIVYALVTASICALIAIGLNLIAKVARFFNFAHGAVFTIGAYLTYLCQVQLGLGTLPSVFFAVIGGGVVGLLMEFCVFGRIRHRGGSSLVLLLCSLGIYVILQNVVSIIWGDQLRTLHTGSLDSEFVLAGVHLTGIQAITIISAVVLSALLILVLKRSLLGKAIRAVASNLELSRTVGVNPDLVIRSIITFTSMLAALAGALTGLDLSITPTMGMGPLLIGMAAVIIGGSGRKLVVGVLLASLALGFAQAFAVWSIGSRWQESVAFLILMVMLLLKPLWSSRRSNALAKI